MIKNAITLFVFSAFLATGYWYWQTQTVRPAPDVGFKTINGETLPLKTLQGQPVIVTFWATDCSSCIEEIPHLISLHDQYHRNGLTIVAVAMHYDPPNRVITMAKSKQLPYKIALDPEQKLAEAFGHVRLTPTTFLIDKSGNIVLQKVGAFDLAEMQQRIEQL